jgi:glycopeptide antibiotics resistance protein
MSIKNIKNPLIRKPLIIFGAPLLIPLTLIYLVFEVVVANIPDVIECVTSAWKGKEYDH